MFIEVCDRHNYDKYIVNVNKIVICGNNHHAEYPSWIVLEEGSGNGRYLSTLKLEDLAAEINALLRKDLC